MNVKVLPKFLFEVFSHGSSGWFNSSEHFVGNNVSHRMIHSLTILGKLFFPFKQPFALVRLSCHFKSVEIYKFDKMRVIVVFEIDFEVSV